MQGMNIEVTLLFLQYPGLGPIFVPPLHTAFAVGQGEQSPGEVILMRVNPDPGGHC
jgi:hypothetical protein